MHHSETYTVVKLCHYIRNVYHKKTPIQFYVRLMRFQLWIFTARRRLLIGAQFKELVCNLSQQIHSVHTGWPLSSTAEFPDISLRFHNTFAITQVMHTNVIIMKYDSNDIYSVITPRTITNISGWPLSRHCEIPWRFAALLTILTGTHTMPVLLVLKSMIKLVKFIFNDKDFIMITS